MKSGYIKGIGPKTAQLIVDKYGTNTFDIIENEPDKLLSISRISKSKLETIKKSYLESSALKEIITYLTPFQVTSKQAIKIYAQYGSKSMDIVKNDTYRLCDIKGFAFKTVDKIALRLKIAPDSPKRIKGAIIFLLNQCALSGHLYLTKEQLTAQSLALLNDRFIKAVVYRHDIEYALQSTAMKYDIVVEKEAVYRRKAEITYGERVFRLGDKLMQLKNTDILSNGDVGYIKKIGVDENKTKYLTVIYSDNRTYTYQVDELSQIELAYAMTIHKSQGSECDTVIIPIIGIFYPLLKRNLIYIAITRAKKKVIIVGDKRYMKFAME